MDGSCSRENIDLHLLDRFEVVGGSLLPIGSQRLLALLAMNEAGMHRATIAERLWPDSPGKRSAAALRSALWRVRRCREVELIEAKGSYLQLSANIVVDYRQSLALARRILTTDEPWIPRLSLSTTETLSAELLPAWYDEWLVPERERWRQLRLHALETLAERLVDVGEHIRALDVALTATSTDPIRESAHRQLIRIHIARGNCAEALEQYRRYRRLLQRELGVRPTSQMEELVRTLTAR